MHNTSAHPLPQECRSLSAFRINLHGVPHKKEDHESFELPLCEMSEELTGQPNPDNTGMDESTDLPSHIETPPPQGIEWFTTGFPFLLNFV